MKIGLKKKLFMTFDEAVAKVPEALQAEGFGVLTEIDVQKTLAEKLQVPFRRYRILGACNPALAHRALSAEIDVGLLLPCNILVYEGDAGAAVVNMIDPLETLARASASLREVAEEARKKLQQVLDRLN